MTLSTTDKAGVLIQALPYIQKYTDKIVVIKYGGNAMIDDALKQAVMSDLYSQRWQPRHHFSLT